MDSTKEKVKKVVREYIRTFATEYSDFMAAQRVRQDNKVNKFAEMKGHEQLVRHLVEIPESLNLALKMNLEQEQFDWLFGFNEYEGSYNGFTWFIKVFPQFKITDEF